MVEFEKLGRRIEPAEVRAIPVSSKAIPTAGLVITDGNVERAELFWRISVPISALVLTLLAVPFLGGFGRDNAPDNATLLDRDYTTGYLVLVVAVLVLVVLPVWLVTRRRR